MPKGYYSDGICSASNFFFPANLLGHVLEPIWDFMLIFLVIVHLDLAIRNFNFCS